MQILGPIFGMGKSNARVSIEPKSDVTFKDIAGIDEAKEELMELVDFLKTQGLTKLSLKPDRVVAPVPSDFDVASLNQLLVKKKFMVSEIRLEQPSLEEYFVNLTGEGFEVVR
jgi:hypothetical protein